MANSYTERVVLSQQLITCLRELASLAQRSADVFHELGDSVTAIDTTLSRVSVRAAELDRKVGELKASPNGQAALGLDIALASPPRPQPRPLAPISESPSPPQHRAAVATKRAPSLSIFAPTSRPVQEQERYASVRQFTAPVPICVPYVSKGGDATEEEVMKRAHNPSVESVLSAVTDKSSAGASRRTSWRDSFRLPKRRRRLGASSSTGTSTGQVNGDRPRSVDFSHRHTVAFVQETPTSTVTAPPGLHDSSDDSPMAMKEYELERRQTLANGGVRRQHAKSTGEVHSVYSPNQQPLDEHVISALVQRTLHLSGHLDYDLHRPQSTLFAPSAPVPPGAPPGPSERSQSCNGLLEVDDEEEPRRHHYSSSSQQAPMPPPRQGSLLRASSMPMSPDAVVSGGLDSVIGTPKLKRSMSISQRARALFRPVSQRRSRSRSKEGHLSEDVTEITETSLTTNSSADGPSSGCVTGSTVNVERRRKGRGRSKSPISWLLSRIHPPGQQAHLHHSSSPAQPRAVSCVESALTVMHIDADPPVFDAPAPSRTPTAASSMAQLFRRRSRSREKGVSPKKGLAVPGGSGQRLAGQFRPGSRSPGDGVSAGSSAGVETNPSMTYHRFRADSDDVDYYVRRHIIDFPSQDADDFHVDFSRLATLRLRREALVSASTSTAVASSSAMGAGPEPAVPLAHVRHFLQSGRDLMTRRGRHRHSRRQTDRYSADATPSNPSTGSEITPVPSPGLMRLQAVRPTSLTFKQQAGPSGPTSPRLRAVATSGVAGVGSLAEQLDKLSSQFSNAVSLRRGYKGSGSRSSSGHWSVSTSSLHPKRSSYMSNAGQPTSPLSNISAMLPGSSLARSVSKDSALDSSSPCERPVSELVNVSGVRSVEVQTDKSAVAVTPRPGDALSLGELRPPGVGDDDVFCRSSAETLSSVPPAPPPRSASLRRQPGMECENTLYQTKSFAGSGDGFSVPSRSRPTTPGRSAERAPLPLTMPYRSGTLPRNLKSRLKKGGSDTLKRLENSYRTPDDYAGDTGDTDSDSISYSDRRASSSASDVPPLDTAVDSPPVQPVEVVDIAHYAVVDLGGAPQLPTAQQLHMKQQQAFHQHHLPHHHHHHHHPPPQQPLIAPIAMKASVMVNDPPTPGPTLLQHPHHLRSPHLSSNSHLSSFSGDSDTGSSCSGPNPYQRLYSLSLQPRTAAGEAGNAEGGGGRVKQGRASARRLLPEPSG